MIVVVTISVVTEEDLPSKEVYGSHPKSQPQKSSPNFAPCCDFRRCITPQSNKPKVIKNFEHWLFLGRDSVYGVERTTGKMGKIRQFIDFTGD